MTNEELAALAKAGDREALVQLWEQNRGLLAKLFGELAGKAGARMAAMGVTWEDVEQCFYLAIVDAVALYEPERGTMFTSFLRYPVQTVFFELIGWRTERQKHDPLGSGVSLNEPIYGEDGSTVERCALLPDPVAAQPFEDAEERLYNEQLHAVLEDCLNRIEERPAAAIRARYFEGTTFEQTGKQMGISTERARQLERKGLRQLRSGGNVRRLRQFREQVISTQTYHGTGFAAWNRGGSVQERTVLYLEDKGVI